MPSLPSDRARQQAHIYKERTYISKNYDELFVKIGRRDGFACAGCTSADSEMQIDHIIPVSIGGNSDLDNLQLLCKRCNRHKMTSTVSLREHHEQVAARQTDTFKDVFIPQAWRGSPLLQMLWGMHLSFEIAILGTMSFNYVFPSTHAHWDRLEIAAIICLSIYFTACAIGIYRRSVRDAVEKIVS